MNTTVDNAIYNFFSATGKSPDNLYLGRKQMKVLVESGMLWYEGPGLQNRYSGCLVFEVNAEDHIGVG